MSVRWKLSALLAACLLLLSCAAAQAQGMEHYLLVGVDGWGLSEESGARSDAIVLATLHYDRERVTLVSFARDCLVQPSYRKGMTKLNTLVRSSHGDQTLVDYIEETFLIPISGYFLVNFSGAADVINAIGGVEIDLTQEEAMHLKAEVGLYPENPLQEGICRLNGAQAVAYMRCRTLDNDFGRQHRQGNVLRAAFRSLTKLGLLEALSLLDDLMGMYRTDMPLLEQAALVRDALGLRHAQIQTHSLPVSGTYKYGDDGRGGSGILFDLETNRRQLWQWLGMETALPEAADAEP